MEEGGGWAHCIMLVVSSLRRGVLIAQGRPRCVGVSLSRGCVLVAWGCSHCVGVFSSCVGCPRCMGVVSSHGGVSCRIGCRCRVGVTWPFVHGTLLGRGSRRRWDGFVSWVGEEPPTVRCCVSSLTYQASLSVVVVARPEGTVDVPCHRHDMVLDVLVCAVVDAVGARSVVGDMALRGGGGLSVLLWGGDGDGGHW
jgi:hypothetical protein